MTIVDITGGICGFTTTVTTETTAPYTAVFHLESDCPNWRKVEEILGGEPLNAMEELFKDKTTGTLNSRVLEVSLATIPHVSCPVISGILKSIEVSTSLALPKDAAISFRDA